MFELIDILRRKPERVKKRIAFLSSFFLAGIIFVIWVSVIYPDFRKNQKKSVEISKNSPSPISTFSDTVLEGFAKVGKEIGTMKDLMTGFSAGSTYYFTSSTSPAPTPVIVEDTATTTTE